MCQARNPNPTSLRISCADGSAGASHACDERALETHLADLSLRPGRCCSPKLVLTRPEPSRYLPTSDDVAIPDSHFRVLLLRPLAHASPAWPAQLLLPRHA